MGSKYNVENKNIVENKPSLSHTLSLKMRFQTWELTALPVLRRLLRGIGEKEVTGWDIEEDKSREKTSLKSISGYEIVSWVRTCQHTV